MDLQYAPMKFFCRNQIYWKGEWGGGAIKACMGVADVNQAEGLKGKGDISFDGEGMDTYVVSEIVDYYTRQPFKTRHDLCVEWVRKNLNKRHESKQ
jgi:hypothetical protein